MMPGFALSAKSHYQLSNRFALAWKLASMQVPVVLVYLGFLNAEEMGNGRFRNHEHWGKCVVDRSRGVVIDADGEGGPHPKSRSGYAQCTMANKAHKSRKRPYSDDDRASALAALAANGGNVERTARDLGIARTTLRQWAAGTRHPEATQMSHGKMVQLAERLEEVAWKLADRPRVRVAVAAGRGPDVRLLRRPAVPLPR